MRVKNKLSIREIQKPELAFLDEMLYEAIFIPEGEEKPPRDVLEVPEVSRYVKNFGRPGDICLVAELDGELVGAIWTRLYSKDEKGFGFVNEKTPELSMAVKEEQRSRGIGRMLMNRMMEKLKAEGYKQVSLSVDKRNFAYKLYRKFGFVVVGSTEDSFTMVKSFIEKM